MHVIAPFLLATGWQAWVQPIAVLLSVAAAAAWLTARWLIRRRSGCTGDCSRCAAATSHHHPAGPGACQKPTTGVRPPGLQVLQGPTNVPRPTDV